MAITKLVADSLGAGATPNQSAFKNIIINGDMSIAQRGTSVSGITGNGYYTSDRFRISLSSVGTWTQSQSTDVPSGQGFTKSLKMDCTTANASLSANSLSYVAQFIEGQNLQYLKKGTANAESLTLSFWVKSNKTGTYIIQLWDRDNTRSISKSYTIDSASTWEKKTITFAGDTIGAFDNDNADSLRVVWFLCAGTDYTSGTLQTSWDSVTNANRAVGQVNLADTVSNYINITGVQLEAGTTASDFEFLPYDVNLGRCQRYYYKIGATAALLVFGASGQAFGTTGSIHPIPLPYNFRTIPAALEQSGTAGDYKVWRANTAAQNLTAVPTFNIATNINLAMVQTTVAGNLVAGNATFLSSTNSNAYLAWSVEL